MFLWSTGCLSRELRKNATTMLSKVLYVGYMVLQYATGFLVFQAIPTVYRYIFTFAKQHIDARTGHPSLTVHVFTETPEWFPWILTLICILGVIACIIAHVPQTFHAFVDRVVSLNTPISNRILFVSLLFYCLPIIFGGLYFANELYALQQAIANSPMGSNPISFMWSIFTRATGIKAVLNGLSMLEGAQTIFQNINLFSFQAYLASYWIALASTALYFWELQKRLRSIATKS